MTFHAPFALVHCIRPGSHLKTVEDASDDTDVLDVLEGLDLDNLFVDVNEDTIDHRTQERLFLPVSGFVFWHFLDVLMLDLLHLQVHLTDILVDGQKVPHPQKHPGHWNYEVSSV